jgi:hypothetical protein
MECLLIPVGQIFGSQSAPSWWCKPAECRAHAASVLEYSSCTNTLADSVVLSGPPTELDIAAFTQAVPDAIHQDIHPHFANRTHHTTFVDDNVTAEVRSHMAEAIRVAVGSANDFFGHPAENRRDPCLKAGKLPTMAGPVITHLGYTFDSCRMRISWPDDKRESLHTMLLAMLQDKQPSRAIDIAKVLGLVRHGAFLCPMGEFLLIWLLWTLNETVKRAGANHSSTSKWWRRQHIRLPLGVYDDLSLLHHCSKECRHDSPTIWSRPIALLIRRQATATVLSDASYGGIGGWSSEFAFLWRLTSADLVACGHKSTSDHFSRCEPA